MKSLWRNNIKIEALTYNVRAVLLKLKSFEFFCVFLHYRSILFLHIERLYKVGNGNLLG